MPMRGLKVLVVVMGVLIVIGIAVVIATIAKRTMGGVPVAGPAAVAPYPGGPVIGFANAVLDEPAGTRIAGISALGERLAVRLEGGGADRVLLLDARDGKVVGRIGLAR